MLPSDKEWLMKRAHAVAILIMLMTGTFSSCGGGSELGPSTGIDRSKTAGSLDSTEAAILCDWSNGKQGGYGRSVSCPSGQQTTDSSKASCLSGIPLLTSFCPALTVGDAEDCVNAIGTDLCAIETAPACAVLWACMS
jgi:hypothetical protein